MNNSSIYFFIVLTTVLHICLAQLNSVPIKSHKVLTTGINSNQVQWIYDNNTDTIGSFYSSSDKNVSVEFDLGKNYLIEHVLIRMKKEKSPYQISLSVGNTFRNQGALTYSCEVSSESEEIYKCQPLCRSKDIQRSGIIARQFILRLLIPSKWVSVYEIQVFSKPVSVSDDISSNRLVLPLLCSSQSWLLTDKTSPSKQSIATVATTEIFLEKPYIVTEVVVEFENAPPKTLNIVLMSGEGKQNSLVITLSDCQAQKSQFTCDIKGKTFVSRVIKVVTSGLTKIFVRGKPVFYPEVKMKTSGNVNERLQMSCEYSQCDLSVHSDCSPETIKTGVKFDCVNKRLIRTPSGTDKDSYIIVNRGKVESVWQSTRFSVDVDNVDRMVVSMPRGYQYFGQYKCSCVVADKMNTDIKSEVTDLKESDFLKDLFFETSVQYKLTDNEAKPFQNASNNIIYVSKSAMETNYFPVRITMYSLVSGINFNVTYPSNEQDTEPISLDRSTTHAIMAFNQVSQSWSVATHKYVVDDIYPELVHGKGISISGVSVTYKRQQNEFIRILDEDKVKLKPSMWSSENGTNTMQVNIMYSNPKESNLYYVEKNCVKQNIILLATFTGTTCKSMDARLTCLNYKNSMLLTFKDERNFAKKVTLDLKYKSDDSLIDTFSDESKIVLNQDDVVIKHRYTSLVSSAKNPNVNVVKVAIEIVSKKVIDFIPCGSVSVKIVTSSSGVQKMVAQNSTFNIELEMITASIDMTIVVTIDNISGTHQSTINITDPTTFKANQVEFQEDQTLNLLWHGIDDVARDLLASYEVKTDTITISCNTTAVDVKSVPKSQTSGAKNRYQTPMTLVSQRHMSTVIVNVTPVFTGGKRGQPVSMRKNLGVMGPTMISLDDIVLPTERTITVTPSQADISCDIKDVEFTVTGINVEKFQWKSKSSGVSGQYIISNLVPGRNYQITAKVLYKNGPSDEISKIETFESADDISVVKTKHVAQINERVNITCTAEIGPDDKYRKVVEWLRADKSLLPDGVKSVVLPSMPRVAYLIMEKALADYSGEYSCFAKPSATVGSAKITIVVNDLVVTPSDAQVQIGKGSNVSVTCSSSVVGKTKLVWVDPSGSEIADMESSLYKIMKMETDQNMYKSILLIKNVTLASTGTYKCHKKIGTIDAKMEFLLYGFEKMKIDVLPGSSKVIGEKLKLRCSAEPGLQNQKVKWEMVTMKDDPVKLVTISSPNSSDNTTQDIEIINSLDIRHVKCNLTPALKEDSEPLYKTFAVDFESKITVSGPTEVKEGTSVKLACVGHPTDKKMKLMWLFYQAENSEGTVVKTSTEIEKSYVPIKLELELSNVKANNSGRYECKFNKETRSPGLRLGKNISLVIKPASDVVNNDNTVSGTTDKAKKSAHTALSNTLLTMLFTAVVFVSFTVHHRS